MVSCLDGLLRDDWAGGCGPAGRWPSDVTPPSSRRTLPMPCTGEVPVANPTNSLKPGGAFPKFEVDLDLPPEQRWRHIYESQWAKDIKEKTFEGYKAFLESQVQIPYNQKLFKSVEASMDKDLIAEMRGIADLTGLSYEQVLAANLRYESYTVFGCSAVIAAREDGTVVMGKCYDMIPKTSEFMMEVTFTKGGKKLFLSMGHYLLSVGVHTGMRFGSFVHTHNTSMRQAVDGREDRLQSAAEGGVSYLLECRDWLATIDDYYKLVERIQKTKFIATQHLTFAGTTGGCVVTTSPIEPPRIQHLDPKNGVWFLYQSNDDWWKPSLDNRRRYGVRYLTKMGRHNVSEESVFAVMQSKGISNFCTDFIAAFTPAEGSSRVMHGFEAPNRNYINFCSTLATIQPRTKYVILYEMNGGIMDYGSTACRQKIVTYCCGPLQLLLSPDFWKDLLQKICLKD